MISWLWSLFLFKSTLL